MNESPYAKLALVIRQIELEQRMRGMGVERYYRNVERSIEHEDQSATKHGQRLLKAAIEPMAKAIEDFVVEAHQGKAGRRAVAARLLKGIEADTAAFLTVKTAIDLETSIKGSSAQHIAIRVAREVENECRFRFYRRERSAYYDKIMDTQQKRGKNRDSKRRTVIRSMGKIGVEWEAWPEVDRLHLGWKLLELAEAHTGLLEIVGGKNRSTYTIRITEAVDEWVRSFHTMNEALTPACLPTIVPPKPWTSTEGGGYWTEAVYAAPLVKTRNVEYRKQLASLDMPLVFEAVNAIQDTAWKINQPVLDTLMRAWEAGLEIAGLPPQDDRPLPPKPADFDTDVNGQVLKAWKRLAMPVHDANDRARSQRFQVGKTLWVANMLRSDAELYFPHHCDFRGRVYATSMFLNPQGVDYSKALLTFAHGKSITDQRAAGWLAIHGANTYGYDKAAMVERIEWVEKHEQEIMASAADPMTGRFWCDADKPWQFLAFCFEWAEFRRQGYGFVSSLPIALDGTCNGLQHFSAMLRDPVGGEAVNLVPSAKPQDIYQRVADVTIERLKQAQGEEAELAGQLLDFGITRKTTKRSVMVLPYGGTLFSCRGYVTAHLVERLQDGETAPFANDPKVAGNFLAKTIWDSIGDVVVSAKQAMAWLQGIAKVTAKKGKPLTWTTPAGFVALQHYPNEKMHRVETMLHGEFVYVTLTKLLETINPKRQATGISPNFVHSMDAAALMLTVVRLKSQGIGSFAMIHDSYGTVAADAETLGRGLREVFVEMYEQHNVLAEFLDSVRSIAADVELPEVPPMGSLDIAQVLKSEFFFA